jgi:hypothetical protein
MLAIGNGGGGGRLPRPIAKEPFPTTAGANHYEHEPLSENVRVTV